MSFLGVVGAQWVTLWRWTRLLEKNEWREFPPALLRQISQSSSRLSTVNIQESNILEFNIHDFDLPNRFTLGSL
jgi:hypothetical protein